MPSAASQPPSSPTVEEVKDDRNTETNGETLSGDQKPFSWPELCSQHEKVLSSHLDLLNAAGGSNAPDDAPIDIISSMAATTHKLVTQFRVLRRKMSNQHSFQSFSQGAHAHSASSRTGSESTPKDRRKRARLSKSSSEADVESPDAASSGLSHSQKRKRVNEALPGGNQDVRDIIPVSDETEDISEEVQRRLKLKEERRRQANSQPQPSKRKRESLESIPSTPASSMVSNPRKKARMNSDAVPSNEIAKRRTAFGEGDASTSASEGKRGPKRHKKTPSSRGL